MMDRLEQFVEDRLPATRLGRRGTPPGAALGLTLSRVACFPVLAAPKGGVGAVLQPGLRWNRGG